MYPDQEIDRLVNAFIFLLDEEKKAMASEDWPRAQRVCEKKDAMIAGLDHVLSSCKVIDQDRVRSLIGLQTENQRFLAEKMESTRIALETLEKQRAQFKAVATAYSFSK